MKNQSNLTKIIIDGYGTKNWIGGLYYRRNIIFSLLSNQKIKSQCEITVLTSPECADVFAPLKDKIKIVSIPHKFPREYLIKSRLYTLFSGAQYVFPARGRWCKLLSVCGIDWIPDFQHNRMPEFFSKEECQNRTESFQSSAKSNCPLVLSSNDCLMDFQKYYASSRKNVYVVPFVSYIEPELKGIGRKQERDICEKFSLQGKKFAVVMNQFWKHKNHIVVLQAIKKYFQNHPEDDFYFVFTGALNDYRNPEYIQSIKDSMEDVQIREHIKVLGFIDRMEQLVILKNAEYVIQPSLFEGWGTVVEDAKVLDKTILLSDIPVHREQKNDKCILFDPYDGDMLANLIAKENKKQHTDDITAGIADMKSRAETYSKGFERLLFDMGTLKE